MGHSPTRIGASVARRVLLKSRFIGLCALIVLLLFILDIQIVRFRSRPPLTVSSVRGRPERVFIASLHWNTSDILRNHWTRAMLELSEALGQDNIYFSAYANNSPDDTLVALEELELALKAYGVRYSIQVDDETHAQEIESAKSDAQAGWIETAPGIRQLRRIPYLAKLRNRSFRPLYEMAVAGEFFDKIIYLNDVVFHTDDVLQLLDTNNGEYAAACAMDFVDPPGFYDSFALFDSDKNQYWTRTWPYFRSQASRQAMMQNRPVPVKSCWNGIVVFDAAPFYNRETPLRFRAVSDSLAQEHVEASECCLIHADNPLSKTKGIFVNPNVRVGYSGPAYDAINDLSKQRSIFVLFRRVWLNRIRRWFIKAVSKDRLVVPRYQTWEATRNETEAGAFCLINEMQVLSEDGWHLVEDP